MPTIHLRRRLAELDTQIAEHRRALSELENTRIAVERELSATATFPVLTLPIEITAEIFVRCLPPFANLGWIYGLDQFEDVAPILLTRVCRTWRDIALTTPALWSTLSVEINSIPRHAISDPRSVDNFIDRWLVRAGRRPLSLVFRGEALRLDTLSILTNVIQRYSHEVRYLELYTDWNLLPLLALESLTFPLLENASLNFSRERLRHPQLVNVFDNSPRLHGFRLVSIDPTDSSICLALPWLQLTKYDGLVPSFQLFANAPNLTEVTCSLESTEHSSFTGITHARLSSLAVTAGAHRLLEYLTLPALQHLDISFDDDYAQLETFLIRSSPPLVSLSVLATDDDFEWTQCLTHVGRTLENIHFDSPSPKIISSLFAIEGSGILCPSSLPNIRRLSLNNVAPESGPGCDRIVQFLYSRRLRSFRLVWDYSPFLDGTCYAGPDESLGTISGHLSDLACAGVDIYLGTEDKNYAPVHRQMRNSGGAEAAR